MNKSVIAALSAAVILVCAIVATLEFGKPIDEMRRDMWRSQLTHEISHFENLGNMSLERVDPLSWLDDYDKTKEKIVILYWDLYGEDVSNYSWGEICKLPVE